MLASCGTARGYYVAPRHRSWLEWTVGASCPRAADEDSSVGCGGRTRVARPVHVNRVVTARPGPSRVRRATDNCPDNPVRNGVHYSMTITTPASANVPSVAVNDIGSEEDFL